MNNLPSVILVTALAIGGTGFVFLSNRIEAQSSSTNQQKPPQTPATPTVEAKAADNPAPSATNSLKELERAMHSVGQYSSVQARIVETIQLPERSIKAEGRYLQGNMGARDYRMRLELKLKVGSQTGSLLEVCDGQILWTRHEIGNQPIVTRRNIQEILKAAERSAPIPHTILISNMGLGGLTALLGSMHLSMNFQGIKPDELRDRPVFVIQGAWKDEYVALWRGVRQNQDKAYPDGLPSFVPDLVWLSVDQENGFPHRIQYRKRIPGRTVSQPILTLDYLDVVLNEPLSVQEFEFKEPDRPTPIDRTDEFIKQFVPQSK
ncbi:MAG: hypothetical protein HZA46_22375 [Planctomycetales bacterium]|nr:hypothetical protein [Planctomycetales bacterium]